MALIGAVLFCAYAYANEGGGWSQNTHFDPQALGTRMWAFAVVFCGHALCASFLILALAAAWALRWSRSRQEDLLLAALVALGGGWATLSEYLALVPAALIAWFAIQTARAGGRPRASRVG